VRVTRRTGFPTVAPAFTAPELDVLRAVSVQRTCAVYRGTERVVKRELRECAWVWARATAGAVVVHVSQACCERPTFTIVRSTHVAQTDKFLPCPHGENLGGKFDRIAR